MKAMEDLRMLLTRELDEIAMKGEMSAGDLETVHKLTDTIKNIDKICYMEENGYSMDGGWRAEGNYSRGGRMNSYGDYDSGNSYARHYVRGHYSRGYSEAKEDLMKSMKVMMEDASINDSDKRSIERAMNALR